jgi:hypothetical protein
MPGKSRVPHETADKGATGEVRYRAARAILSASERIFAMLDFAYGYLLRSDVIVPAFISVAAIIWFAKRQSRLTPPAEPFNARDMRTWPLWFVFADTLLFIAVLAAITAALGDDVYSYAIAGGVSVLLTFGLAPAILAKLRY